MTIVYCKVNCYLIFLYLVYNLTLSELFLSGNIYTWIVFSFHRLVETVKSEIKEVNSLLNKIIVIIPLFSVLDRLSAGEPMTRKQNVTISIVNTPSSGLIV